ncbi:hypothetical protein V1504DRAFT_436817 [Lipomyces starkeyi]
MKIVIVGAGISGCATCIVGVGGFIPASDLIKANITPGSMTLVFGGNGFFGYVFTDSSASDRTRTPHTSSRRPETSHLVVNVLHPRIDPKTIDKEDVSRQLRERHGHWRDPVVKQIVHSVQLPTWERDGVVLLGDAAHALPPTSGQGTSQALEDVESFTLFLSHYLRKAYHNPLSAQAATERQAIKIAAKRHMDLRRPHVKEILDHAKQMQQSKRSLNIFQEFLMCSILWIVGLVSRGSPAKEAFNYNIAEEVERVLASSLRI